MSVVEVIHGDGPVVLGQPHGGTEVPDGIAERLNDNGRAFADTDWHIAKIYDGLLPSATIVRARVHRYVIDANRDPADVSLYPGQNTTSLCPVTDFDGRPIWRDGEPPDEKEIEARRRDVHAPYHKALAAELDRIRGRHGLAILFDCHSIRSEIPFLFDGILPQFSIGTNAGSTCAASVTDVVRKCCAEAAPAFDTVVDGRFKGGWTTRHYGRPQEGIHAIQMELAQRGYMDEVAPWTYRPDRAERLRPILKSILTDLDALARSGGI